MAVLRSQNWLGQQRCDVPHFRSVESAVAADFDLLAGQILTASTPNVIKGFAISTAGALGSPATSLQVIVVNGIILHQGASESGTIYQVPAGRANEVLSTTNARVIGAFVSNQVNYVGLDLRRSADSTTADLVEFLNADTLQETPQTVPLARTLDYRLVISTTDFTSQTNILPIALITTDASNNVSAIQDARQLMFRLGSGSTVPNIHNSYSWPYTRAENLTGDVFSGGDKGISSFNEWGDAIMTRIWEVGGGPYWYSAADRTNMKLSRNIGTRFTNGDNFEVVSSNVHWQGLSLLFSNSPFLDGSSNPIFSNDIANQTTNSAGLTDLAIGDCLYVDVDQTANRTGGTALVPVKAALASMGSPTIPGSRWILVWRTANGYFTRDSQFGIGTIFSPATISSNGVVELNTAPFSSLNPVVVSADASGNAIAPGLSRGNGAAPDFGGGFLSIGTGSSDGNILMGKAPGAGVGTTYIKGNFLKMGGPIGGDDCNVVQMITNHNGGVIQMDTLGDSTDVIEIGISSAGAINIGTDSATRPTQLTLKASTMTLSSIGSAGTGGTVSFGNGGASQQTRLRDTNGAATSVTTGMTGGAVTANSSSDLSGNPSVTWNATTIAASSKVNVIVVTFSLAYANAPIGMASVDFASPTTAFNTGAAAGLVVGVSTTTTTLTVYFYNTTTAGITTTATGATGMTVRYLVMGK
jgi:hypothetical protein